MQANISKTPREVVSELDQFIVGQHDAKRAIYGSGLCWT